MGIDTVLAIVGIGVSAGFGTGGIVYAVFTNREKKKLETFVKANLVSTAGNVEKIRESAQFAWRNFNYIRESATKLPDSEEKNNIIKCGALGTGDAAAADRMMGNLLNEVLSTQEGLFGTTEIKHPDRKG